MDDDRLLDGLDESQRRAVTLLAEPLCILAGAGSGKTRVLTRRIAHRAALGDLDPRHALALTFTRKAAGELGDRLRALGLREMPAAGTFHGVAYGQLRTRWAGADRRPPALLDRKGPVLGRILGRGRTVTVTDVATEIEWAKARLVGPDDYPAAAARAGRRIGAPAERVAAWYRDYEDEKDRRHLVDFDDLLGRCTEALETDAAFAAAQRWRFQHLFVDEFQDVNPRQHRLLLAWLGERRDLCVVGDPNQAIYRWNGADASFLLRFPRTFPDAEVVHLTGNYRSSPQILAVAHAVLAAGTDRPAALRAHRPDGPVPEVVAYDDDDAEAEGIARAVRDRHGPGTSWSAQAVLVRINGQVPTIERALHRAGIPTRARGSASFLDDPWVRARLASVAGERRGFAVALADLEALLAGADDNDAGDVGEHDEQLATLVRLGHEFATLDPDAPAAAFGPWLATTLSGDDTGGGPAVDLVTFHAAKGLEWPVVHIAGLEAGLVPIHHARTPEAEAEERRLLYVAVTRAEHEVRLTHAASRSFGSRRLDRKPSPYLREVLDTTRLLRSIAAPTPPAAAGLAAVHDRLRSAPPARSGGPGAPADRALFDALVQWRGRAAKAAGLPPEAGSVILPDRTLRAVADCRPADTDELAALPGIGPLKVKEYGDTLLALVAAHGDASA